MMLVKPCAVVNVDVELEVNDERVWVTPHAALILTSTTCAHTGIPGSIISFLDNSSNWRPSCSSDLLRSVVLYRQQAKSLCRDNLICKTRDI